MGQVLGLGVTHYPLLCVPDEHMAALLSWTLEDPDLPPAARDTAHWPDAMRREWSDDRGARAAAEHREQLVAGLARTRAALDDFQPDAVVVIGDDQYDNFREDVIPPFAVLAYDQVTAHPWSPDEAAAGPLSHLNVWDEPVDTAVHVECHRDLALHVVESLLEQDIDVSYSYRPLHHPSLAHSFINTILFLDYERRGFPYPIVPFAVNCYGRRVISYRGRMSRLGDRAPADPPSPSPRRMIQVGRALARAAAESEWNVAIVASSSWSHAFLSDVHHRLRPDTDADRRLYEALVAADFDVWDSVTLADIERSGQHEVLTWFALMGAMQELDGELRWSDFVPSDIFNSNKVFAIFDTASVATSRPDQ
jgi:hypothetical protein